jgi:hypothetical protein
MIGRGTSTRETIEVVHVMSGFLFWLHQPYDSLHPAHHHHDSHLAGLGIGHKSPAKTLNPMDSVKHFLG